MWLMATWPHPSEDAVIATKRRSDVATAGGY